MAKLRAFTVAGEARKVSASRSRPHKPPAKELSRRKAAALSSGGGKLPPRIRKELDRVPMPKRVRTTPAKGAITRTRAGKREPKGGRHDRATEARGAPRPG
ncbi:MAG: hypothetical protein E6I51_02720 [Chloroflexi bacterium]|nr:MAG: hypothetical protein E6I51_02720 [Chloroflexota bacterium]